MPSLNLEEGDEAKLQKKNFNHFAPPAPDGVNLVHEAYSRLMVSGIVKHLPDQPGRLSDVFVHDGAVGEPAVQPPYRSP